MPRLEITLRSDLCAGNGENLGNRVDTDTWLDSFGLPLIPGRRLKGCLRESADFLAENGLFPDEVTARLFGTAEQGAALTVGDAVLPGYRDMQGELAGLRREKDFGPAAAPNSVASLYTHVNGQTRMENGVAAPGSLRFTRVLNRTDPLRRGEPLTFIAPVSVADGEPALWQALDSCCRATRHIGTHRNRGLGQVSVRLVMDESPEEAAVSLPPRPAGDEITLEYRLALDANVVLQVGGEGLNMIPGRTVIGVMASEWLREHPADAVFDDLFLNGAVRWSDLTPVISGKRGVPAPQYMAWSRNLNAYVNLYDAKEGEIGKTKAADGLFAAEEENGLRLAGVGTDMVYHHRHARGNAEAQLYRHESLESGLILAGRVTFPARRWDQVTCLIGAPRIRIGHSRSAQYAACRLTEIRTVPTKAETFDAPEGKRVYAVLESDLVLSRNGLYTAAARDVREAIAEALGLDPEAGENDRCRYRTLGGYHAAWGLRKPQITAAAGGSVYAFISRGKALPREVTLGEFPQEGLGRVRVLREDELFSSAVPGRADRVTDWEADGRAGLRTALTLQYAEEAVRRSADAVFGARGAAWATRENNGLMNRLRSEGQGSATPGEFLQRIRGIKDDAKRKTAEELFKALYGSGSDEDVLKGMLARDPEALRWTVNDREAKQALLARWRTPLMILLHAVYFSKAGDNE